jgi:hypothetical protein
MCSGLLCCVCSLIHLSSWFFLCFVICGLFQVLFLSFVLNFSISILPVTTLRLDLFSGTHHKNFLCLWCPVVEINSICGVRQFTCFFAWKWIHFKKIRQWTKSQKRLCQLTLVVLWSLIWISWPLNTGPTDCPEILVRNYYKL